MCYQRICFNFQIELYIKKMKIQCEYVNNNVITFYICLTVNKAKKIKQDIAF